MPAGGIFTTAASGATFSFGSALMTARGQTYRLCWCAGVFECDNRFEVFRTDIGELTVLGPSVAPIDRTCVSGLTCQFRAVEGNWHVANVGVGGPSAADEFIILDTCTDTGSVVPGIPFGGLLVSASGGTAGWGATPITPHGGDYRICWCAGGYPCGGDDASQHLMDIGTMWVVGPSMVPRRAAREELRRIESSQRDLGR